MPGMTLRAWAHVSAAGVLIDGSPNVSGASKVSTGTYAITLSDGNASAYGVLKGLAQSNSTLPLFVGMKAVPVTNTVTYMSQGAAGGAPLDSVCHVELWE